VGNGKMAFWRTKAAISLKRVKMEEKLLWIGGPVGTHQRSFERYHPRSSMPPPSHRRRRRGQGARAHLKFEENIFRAIIM